MTTPLERLAAAEPDALKACVQAYGNLVWSMARRLAGRDAEDAVQDVFAELWSCAHRFDPNIASDKAFVAMIARRRLVDRLRSKVRREALGSEPLTDTHVEPGLGGSPEICAEAAIAARALATLPEAQRRVLTLSIRHGLSHSEISAELGMPLGTVKANARRGLARVRELLDIRHDDAEEEKET